MLEKKSNHSHVVQSMIHGRPSQVRCGQPCMYEILQWAPQNQKNDNHVDQCPVSESRLIQKQEGEENVENYENIQDTEGQNELVGKQAKQRCNIHKKGHEIKQELYMYETVKLRKSQSVDVQNNQGAKESPGINKAKIKEAKKLDINNEDDRKQINKREERIKQFKQLTRDLPNSAFVTYYGKPAFEAYGRCNSQKNMKTHNVMPHKGSNHPKEAQSYKGAIFHGKKIHHENTLPRKPLSSISRATKTEEKEEKGVESLPLQKPDLVNHVRFASAEKEKGRKERAPTQSTSSLTKKKQQKVMQKSKGNTKSKKNKKNKNALNFNDGLKYMNIRTDLLQLMQARKTKNSQLAYKVTECYPLDWECEKECSVHTNHKMFEDKRPAGKNFKKGDAAKTVIYQKKESEEN